MKTLPMLIVPAGCRSPNDEVLATERDVTAWLTAEGIDALEIVQPDWGAESEV